MKEALRLAPSVADAAAGRARVASPVCRRAPQVKGAMPNLFEFTIAEALDAPGATVESVAAAIASSSYFLKAVRLGMDYVAPSMALTNQGSDDPQQARHSALRPDERHDVLIKPTCTRGDWYEARSICLRNDNNAYLLSAVTAPAQTPPSGASIYCRW